LSTPQEQGRQFEAEFAKRLGATVVPGSGSQWFAKLDVGGKGFLWSLKLTTKKSFRLTTDMLRELTHAVHGPGGKGGRTVPGMAIRIDNEDWVLLKADDFIGLMREEVKMVPPTKREEKLERAAVPKFKRTDDA
jgi:hypothetical protein